MKHPKLLILDVRKGYRPIFGEGGQETYRKYPLKSNRSRDMGLL